MKKLLSIPLLVFALSVSAQKDDKKKDSVIQITVTRDAFTSLLNAINDNIDSKKTSKDVIDFLIKSAILVPKKEK